MFDSDGHVIVAYVLPSKAALRGFVPNSLVSISACITSSYLPLKIDTCFSFRSSYARKKKGQKSLIPFVCLLVFFQVLNLEYTKVNL